jgi:multiple sugar transport system substrate-binding protein
VTYNRRQIIKGTAAATGAVAAASALDWAEAWAQEQPFKPEKGARLRFLRWNKFLDAEDKATTENIAAFTKATGVEVKIDNVWQDDVQTKAAVAANVGKGPDIVWALHTTPHLFPEKLLDVSDVADYVGKKHGGWYPMIEQYGKSGRRWVGIPNVVIGVLPVYRVSWFREAGVNEFPKTTDAFLKAAQDLKKSNHPMGFCFGKTPNDGNVFNHWLLWAFGGRVVDENNRPAISSPQTLQALEYARALHDAFIPGTVSWNDASNNKAFLAGEISATNNAVSVYGKALADKMDMANDINHALWPVGPTGTPAEMHLVYPLITFRYTKYPNAAKAFIAYMFEKAQYERLLEGSAGYVSQVLKGYESNPVWGKDPKVSMFRDVAARGRPVSHAGSLGYASASVLSDYVVCDMFGEVVTNSAAPKDAMTRAEKRIERYYKV